MYVFFIFSRRVQCNCLQGCQVTNNMLTSIKLMKIDIVNCKKVELMMKLRHSLFHLRLIYLL